MELFAVRLVVCARVMVVACGILRIVRAAAMTRSAQILMNDPKSARHPRSADSSMYDPKSARFRSICGGDPKSALARALAKGPPEIGVAPRCMP